MCGLVAKADLTTPAAMLKRSKTRPLRSCALLASWRMIVARRVRPFHGHVPVVPSDVLPRLIKGAAQHLADIKRARATRSANSRSQGFYSNAI
jgi:hypothetical protein